MDKKKEINSCIRRIKRGDGNAVPLLYRLIGKNLYFRALRFFRNAFDADDVMQDFFADIEVFCKKMTVVGNGYGYLVHCFENLCKMRLRADKTREQYTEPWDPDWIDSVVATDDETTLRQRLLKQTFDKAQSKMNDIQKRVFTELRFGITSVREIAADLGTSKSTVDRVKKKVFEIVRETLIEDGWDKNDV